MIVGRVSARVKFGRMEEAVALVKAEWQRYPLPHATRIYTSNLGPTDTLVLEFEFESMAEYEKFFAGWGADPGTAVYAQGVGELLDPGGTSEIWDLRQ